MTAPTATPDDPATVPAAMIVNGQSRILWSRTTVKARP